MTGLPTGFKSVPRISSSYDSDAVSLPQVAALISAVTINIDHLPTGQKPKKNAELSTVVRQ